MKLEVILNQRGDLITSISEAYAIAKAVKANFYLNLECGTSIIIRAESDMQDLINLAMNEFQIIKLKHELEKAKDKSV